MNENFSTETDSELEVVSLSGAVKPQSVGVALSHLRTLINGFRSLRGLHAGAWWEFLYLIDCPELYLAMSSAKPYIGCKIGLISKAQNRYEGILYTIDKVNSTVVLAKGECCRPFGGFLLRFCWLKKMTQLKHKYHFVSFIKQFLSLSQVFWNGGTTHWQTNTTQRWYLWVYHFPWKWH